MCKELLSLTPTGSNIAGADRAEFVLRNISITGSMVRGMLAMQRYPELAQTVTRFSFTLVCTVLC